MPLLKWLSVRCWNCYCPVCKSIVGFYLCPDEWPNSYFVTTAQTPSKHDVPISSSGVAVSCGSRKICW